MGKTKKKYDYRAQQAHKRNQQKIADAKADAKLKNFFRMHGLHLVLGILAAIVLIVAIWLVCKWSFGPGGSIPNWFGTLRDVEENWVITNTGSNTRPKYFKLGEVADLEGYTRTDSSNIYGDELVQSFTYTADSEDALIRQAYISGVAGTSAADMLTAALSYYETSSEPKTATINGHEVHYGYLVSEVVHTHDHETGEVLEGMEDETPCSGLAALCIYEDTVQDSSVLVMLQSKESDLTAVPTQEQMEAEMEKFVSLLTVE